MSIRAESLLHSSNSGIWSCPSTSNTEFRILTLTILSDVSFPSLFSRAPKELIVFILAARSFHSSTWSFFLMRI